jgi:hypothetical protein
MISSSDPERGRIVTKRRTTLLLIAGAFTGLVSRAARPNEASRTAPIQPTAMAVPGLPDLKKLGPAHQVRMISHRDGILRVTTADAHTAEFLEMDLRFKIDSSAFGPLRGAPVIVPAGTIGDRAWVFFATPGEIGRFIRDQG